MTRAYHWKVKDEKRGETWEPSSKGWGSKDSVSPPHALNLHPTATGCQVRQWRSVERAWRVPS